MYDGAEHSFICPLDGASSLPFSASKPGKPKGKKKFSSRQKFDVSSPQCWGGGTGCVILNRPATIYRFLANYSINNFLS